MNINELKDFDNLSDDEKQEDQKMIEFGKELDRLGDILDRWVNNPEVLRKREEYLRLQKEGKI